MVIQPNSLGTWRDFVSADLYRYVGAQGIWAGLRTYHRLPGFRYTFWMRTAAYLRNRKFLRPFFWLAEGQRRRCEFKFGISIPCTTPIGPGLYIGHFGCIVVHSEAFLGANCNLSHGVTIGKMQRGERKGCPTIGNGVYFGPGSKVIGKIKVGSNVAIGANCVVLKDVNDNEVVVGIPARVVSTRGSEGYIQWTR